MAARAQDSETPRIRVKAHTLLSNIYSERGLGQQANEHILRAQTAASAADATAAAAAAAASPEAQTRASAAGGGRRAGGGVAPTWPAPGWVVSPRRLLLGGGAVAAAERLSDAPPLFLVRGLLSPAECGAIVAAARGSLRPSGTFA